MCAFRVPPSHSCAMQAPARPQMGIAPSHERSQGATLPSMRHAGTSTAPSGHYTVLLAVLQSLSPIHAPWKRQQYLIWSLHGHISGLKVRYLHPFNKQVPAVFHLGTASSPWWSQGAILLSMHHTGATGAPCEHCIMILALSERHTLSHAACRRQ